MTTEDQYHDIITLLRDSRKAQGKTLEELAFAIGVHSNTLQAWETEKRQTSIEGLLRWTRALGMTLSSLPQ